MYSGHPLGYAAAAAVARQYPMTVLTRALGWARGTQALPQHQGFAARGDHQRHGDPQLLLEGPLREDARTGRHHVRPNDRRQLLLYAFLLSLSFSFIPSFSVLAFLTSSSHVLSPRPQTSARKALCTARPSLSSTPAGSTFPRPTWPARCALLRPVRGAQSLTAGLVLRMMTRLYTPGLCHGWTWRHERRPAQGCRDLRRHRRRGRNLSYDTTHTHTYCESCSQERSKC